MKTQARPTVDAVPARETPRRIRSISTPIHRATAGWVGLVLALVLACPVFASSEVSEPLVTVVGDIAAPNRGAADPFRDALIARFAPGFEQARAFDREALNQLTQHEIETRFEPWSEAHRFSGPRLTDVLAAAGVTDGAVRVFGFDGYNYRFEAETLSDGEFILAIEMDGEPLKLGGHGPAWLLTTAEHQARLHDGLSTDAGLVWGVVLITVE